MIKILKALTPILFMATFSALAGQEGGGGLPIIEPPTDPFLYICKTTLTEQRTIASHTCYAEVVSEYRFSNKDLNPNDHTRVSAHGGHPIRFDGGRGFRLHDGRVIAQKVSASDAALSCHAMLFP